MTETPTFGARLTGILIAASIALAGLFAVLTAYAPEMRDGQDGGGHALSNAATGFSGIVRLAQATGLRVSIGKDARLAPEGGLLVLTPDAGSDPAKVADLVRERNAQDGASPVLIVLPKWQTGPLRLHRGWVESIGAIPGGFAARPVARVADITIFDTARTGCCVTSAAARGEAGPPGSSAIRFSTPGSLRQLRGPGLEVALQAPDGGAAMLWSRSRDVYILADPDLLDNRGMRDQANAAAAVALLRALGGDRGLTFDVTLNGYGRTHNLARLAFEPPFLAMTLCLLAAAVLAGMQTVFRFGTPRATPRAIAFGKRALVDNVAELIRSARREPAMARRYAQLVLETAGATRGAPPGLKPAALAQWLDKRATGPARFADLAEAAERAKTRDETTAAARALHAWQEDVTHDRR